MDMPAWARLRLHPLLMKALMKLKFSKPTLIQEACIGAAAFQGKDVIGAAETGSGKTLAFALPILQRIVQYCGQVFGFPNSSISGEVSSRFSNKESLIASATSMITKFCQVLEAHSDYHYLMTIKGTEGMNTLACALEVYPRFELQHSEGKKFNSNLFSRCFIRISTHAQP